MTDQDRIEGSELQWQTIGVVDGNCLLLVVHTTWDEYEDGQLVEIIRIISARSADKAESRRYEHEIRQV